jgi:hypothetical protein
MIFNMTTTKRSLKDQNRISLFSIIFANVVTIYFLCQVRPLQLEGLIAFAKHWMLILPAGGIFVVTSVACELLDANTKARLVFWRWCDPLPGSRVFSVLIRKDPRIDLTALEAAIGAFPVASREQNSTWYRLYRECQNDAQIVQVHRTFLFNRDYTALSVLFFIACAPLAIWLVRPLLLASGYVGALLFQYLLVRLAAKHQGERFATSVLALIASDGAKPAGKSGRNKRKRGQ